MRYPLVSVVVTLALAGCASSPPSPPADAPPGAKACTEEAKVCPDGSAVARTGPNCEFAPCPGAMAPPAASR